MRNNPLYWVESSTTDPYANLALEETLLSHMAPEDCILYLWQNRRTVVLGRNQNPWRECDVDALLADGGFLARRPSGGGAVYHDLGNLNFTFLAHLPYYNVAKQLLVLQTALETFGIPVVKSGRNDLTALGRKFSGNAFYQTGDRCFHHGTLMVSVDAAVLPRYLHVSPAKLQSKGVASVTARVVNLTELAPDLTVSACKAALVQAFGQVYGGTPLPLPSSLAPPEEVSQRRQRFASWDWVYGRSIPFETELSARFSWGELAIRLHINEGRVVEAVCDSDAMDPDIIEQIASCLTGCLYEKAAMRQAILSLFISTPQEDAIRQDAASLFS